MTYNTMVIMQWPECHDVHVWDQFAALHKLLMRSIHVLLCDHKVVELILESNQPYVHIMY